MPSTAFTRPSSVSKWTRRSSTSRRAISASSQDSREGALVADPGVYEGVEDVHDEAHDDDEERSEEDGALDDREVEAHDRLVGEAPDPLDVEHRLGEDRPAEQGVDQVPAQEARVDGGEGGGQHAPGHDQRLGLAEYVRGVLVGAATGQQREAAD